MVDLFDPGVLDLLGVIFRGKFDHLERNAQLALAITLSENRLTHARLCELSSAHPSDVSKVLRFLVDDGYLSLTGSGRGAVYRFARVSATNPEDVFGESSSTISAASSTISDLSSTISGLGSTIKNSESDISRDAWGRLISAKYRLPFVDSVDNLTPDFLTKLEALAAQPRAKGRMERSVFEEVILRVCDGHFVTIGALAKIVNRGQRTLRQDYLSRMCKEKRLRRAFPDTPNHERQAYTKA